MTMLRLTQDVFLDRGTFSLRSPDPDHRPVNLNVADYLFLELLTRDPGVVVRQDAVFDVLWPGGYRPANPLGAVHVRVHHLRSLLSKQRWPRQLLVTRPGLGWQINTDLAVGLISGGPTDEELADIGSRNGEASI